MLNINPILWLTGRDRIKPAMVWLFLAAVAGVWIYGLAKHPEDWKHEEIYITTSFLVYLGMTGWIGGESCKRFALDRKSGALELLLSTPITVAEIISGQWAGLRRQFLNPMAVVLGMNFLFLILNLDDSDWLIFWISALAIMVADVLAIGWVSMWIGLRTGNIGRSASSSVLLILVLPWIIWGALITVLGVSGFLNSAYLGTNHDWMPRFLILSRMAVSVILDFIQAFAAWGNLMARFRHLATQSVTHSKTRTWFRSKKS